MPNQKTMIDLQVATHHKPIPKHQQFVEWAQLALVTAPKDSLVTIRLVDNKESQTLNRDYRGQNKPTNVLAFPFMDPLEEDASNHHLQDIIMETMQTEQGYTLLGDLVINAPLVKQEAQEQNKPIVHHWAHLVIHGCLHLLGYDHIEEEEATQMENIEIDLLSKLDIANPYDINLHNMTTH